jgi:hypothetical protein
MFVIKDWFCTVISLPSMRNHTKVPIWHPRPMFLPVDNRTFYPIQNIHFASIVVGESDKVLPKFIQFDAVPLLLQAILLPEEVTLRLLFIDMHFQILEFGALLSFEVDVVDGGWRSPGRGVAAC